MNIERLNQAINIMKRAGTIDMGFWQGDTFDTCHTESELHSCGNSACFAGWVAVSPEFQEAGGAHLHNSGAPIFNGCMGYLAIAGWLEAGGLHKEVIELLVTGDCVVLDSTVQWLESIEVKVETIKHDPGSDYSCAHLEGWCMYEAQDVIKILEALRD